jgi:phosphatidylglycerol:prolipoprotein diacylglycerol transferase
MFPILFEIGPLTIRTYGLMIALGFTLAILLAFYRAEGYGINREVVLDLGFYVILAAIIGSRLFYVLQFPGYYLAHPWRILKIWEGGLVFYGGLIGAVAVSVVYLKAKGIPFLKMADLASPSIPLGHTFGRLGCFSAGCCYGLPWEGFCAVTFTDPNSLAPADIHMHPVQLYSAGANFAIFLLLLFLDRRRKFTGQIFLTYLVLYPAARFTLETFRGDDRGLIPGTFLTPAQGVSLLTLAVALPCLLWFWRKHRAGEPGSTERSA